MSESLLIMKVQEVRQKAAFMLLTISVREKRLWRKAIQEHRDFMAGRHWLFGGDSAKGLTDQQIKNRIMGEMRLPRGLLWSDPQKARCEALVSACRAVTTDTMMICVSDVNAITIPPKDPE